MKKALAMLLALALILSLGGCDTPVVSAETTAAPTVQTSSSEAATTAAATTTTRPIEMTTTDTVAVQTTATTTAAAVQTTTTKPPETTTTTTRPPETTTTTTRVPETTTTTPAATEPPLDPITELLISNQWCALGSSQELLEEAKREGYPAGYIFHKDGTGIWALLGDYEGKHTMTGKWICNGTQISFFYFQKTGDLAEVYFELRYGENGPYLRRKRELMVGGQLCYWDPVDCYPLEVLVPTDVSDEEGTGSASLALGDTASTDIIELTVNHAALSYYAEGMSTKTSPVYVRNSSYYPVVNTDTVCLPNDSKDSLFHASKGRVLVCLDFNVKNLDRTHLDTDDGVFAFTVFQDGKTAEVRGYDPNHKDGVNWLDLSLAVFSVNGTDFYSNNSTNLLIDAEESLEIRAVFIAGFEAEDLSAPFELTVLLQDSNDSYQSFVYTVGEDE